MLIQRLNPIRLLRIRVLKSRVERIREQTMVAEARMVILPLTLAQLRTDLRSAQAELATLEG